MMVTNEGSISTVDDQTNAAELACLLARLDIGDSSGHTAFE
jgi:hypothetical protein